MLVLKVVMDGQDLTATGDPFLTRAEIPSKCDRLKRDTEILGHKSLLR